MEILEKLPGITVERHLLLNGSYTAAGVSTQRSYDSVMMANGTASYSVQQAQHNRFVASRKTTSNELHQGKLRRGHEGRQFIENFSTTQYHKYLNKQEIKLELEVLGKSTKHMSRGNSTSDVAPKTISIPSPDNPAPVLKSILKRPGSAISSKSCTILEVMSLDSGMSRLAASLAAHKQPKSNLKGIKTKQLNENRKSLSSKTPSHADLTALDGSTKQLYSDGKQQTNNSRLTTSPTKTVSFKLDPEMQNREKKRSVTKSRRGDARWGVIISSNQSKNPKERTNSPVNNDFIFSRKESKLNAARTRSQINYLKSDAEDEIRSGNSNNSTMSYAMQHPAKNRTSMSEIHHLSEPYRKILMNRALEQTPHTAERQSSRNISLRNYLVEAVNISKSDGSKASKALNLDKRYMSTTHPSNLHKSNAFLPEVKHSN